jgi:phosphonate transport system ATP-binding protein
MLPVDTQSTAAASPKPALSLRARPVLRLVSVSKRFPSRTVLDAVSLEIGAGEFTVLVGASGAGKSTLFRCITRLLRPDAGRIEMDGIDMTDLDGRKLRDMRCKIGLIFQQFNLIGRMSALDNVLVGRLGTAATWRVLARRFGRPDRQRALAALDRVALIEKAYQRADTLSGGEQQRIAIARVLAQEAKIILADEPVSSLDPSAAHNVLDVLKQVARAYRIAVLCCLHQTDLACRYADRIVGLREGRLCLDEPAETLDKSHLMAIYQGASDD